MHIWITFLKVKHFGGYNHISYFHVFCIIRYNFESGSDYFRQIVLKIIRIFFSHVSENSGLCSSHIRHVHLGEAKHSRVKSIPCPHCHKMFSRKVRVSTNVSF